MKLPEEVVCVYVAGEGRVKRRMKGGMGTDAPLQSSSAGDTTVHVKGMNGLATRTMVFLGFIFAGLALVIAVVAIIVAASSGGRSGKSSIESTGGDVSCGDGPRPRNVIMFISDGMGPSYATLARDAKQYLADQGRGTAERLALDAYQSGLSKTRSLNSLVTDSAAGATALATGFKTYNGWISDIANRDVVFSNSSGYKGYLEEGHQEDLRQIKTVLEGAEEKNMWTGLVTTARMTHATPAAFSSHTENRDNEDIIAEQQLDHGIEVLLGGGRRNYIPQDMDGSRRKDDRDLIAYAKDKGYRYVETADALSDVSRVPVLGLFNNSHISYAIDRVGMPGEQPPTYPTEEPTLAQMTAKAIELLSPSPTGFFLMVEAARIDHAGHGNDAATAMAEVLEYDDAFKLAVEFAERDGRTLIVGTSDHDTGGLSIGCCSNYQMFSEPMLAMRKSIWQMVKEAKDFGVVGALREALLGGGVTREVVNSENVTEAIGVWEMRNIIDVDRYTKEEREYDDSEVARVISSYSLVGFTTYGHSGGDVNVYSRGPGQEWFTGVLENSEVGQRIIQLLDVDAGINATVF